MNKMMDGNENQAARIGTDIILYLWQVGYTAFNVKRLHKHCERHLACSGSLTCPQIVCHVSSDSNNTSFQSQQLHIFVLLFCKLFAKNHYSPKNKLRLSHLLFLSSGY